MKTGNNNSSLLSQFIKAAESAKPKAKSDFAEGIFKAAKVKTASVEEIINAALTKKAQADPPSLPGMVDPMTDPGSPDQSPDIPPADEHDDAKRKIAEALVSMCGGDVEACCDFIKSCCGATEGLPEEAGIEGAGVEGPEGPVAEGPTEEPAPMMM